MESIRFASQNKDKPAGLPTAILDVSVQFLVGFDRFLLLPLKKDFKKYSKQIDHRFFCSLTELAGILSYCPSEEKIHLVNSLFRFDRLFFVTPVCVSVCVYKECENNVYTF